MNVWETLVTPAEHGCDIYKSMCVVVVPDSRSVIDLAGHRSGFSWLSFRPEHHREWGGLGGGGGYKNDQRENAKNP